MLREERCRGSPTKSDMPEQHFEGWTWVMKLHSRESWVYVAAVDYLEAACTPGHCTILKDLRNLGTRIVFGNLPSLYIKRSCPGRYFSTFATSISASLSEFQIRAPQVQVPASRIELPC
jgi:hypothetical protein